jgi:short-subunit dehydrogenase
MNNSAKGKVVIITGASSGIGAGVACRLASDGMCLALAARRVDRLKQVAAEVEALGGEALVVPTDVSKRKDIERMLQATLDRWGRVDVLFNNAGVGYDEKLLDTTPEDIHAEIQVNLTAVIECTQVVLPVMLKQGFGHIINTSSLSGLIATPSASIYSATKFGVIGFSDSMRRELRGTAIKVSAFAPGFIPTEFSPRLKAIADGDPHAPKLPGVMPVTYVADQIARLIQRPRMHLILPVSWRILVLAAFLFPGLADLLVSKFTGKGS